MMDEKRLQALIDACKKNRSKTTDRRVDHVADLCFGPGSNVAGRWDTAHLDLFIYAMVLLDVDILVTCFGINRFVLIRHFRIYDRVTEGRAVTTLEELMFATRFRRDVIISEMRWLTKKGFFGQARFERGTGRFIRLDVGEKTKQPPQKPAKRTVNCPHCGGLNQLTMGETAACPYCDRTIFDGVHWDDL